MAEAPPPSPIPVPGLPALLLAGTLVALPGAMPAQAAPPPAPACAPDQLWILGEDGTAQRIAVELALTPAARAQGLMHRRALAPGTGMLFVYEHPQPVAFWMRNTLIPLDMLFIDAEGVIRRVHPRAVPLDETPIPGAAPGDPDPDRLMVLEIGGGEAAALGLAEGMAIMHPALPQAGARHPCP